MTANQTQLITTRWQCPHWMINHRLNRLSLTDNFSPSALNPPGLQIQPQGNPIPSSVTSSQQPTWRQNGSSISSCAFLLHSRSPRWSSYSPLKKMRLWGGWRLWWRAERDENYKVFCFDQKGRARLCVNKRSEPCNGCFVYDRILERGWTRMVCAILDGFRAGVWSFGALRFSAVGFTVDPTVN